MGYGQEFSGEQEPRAPDPRDEVRVHLQLRTENPNGGMALAEPAEIVVRRDCAAELALDLRSLALHFDRFAGARVRCKQCNGTFHNSDLGPIAVCPTCDSQYLEAV
jgi:predicted Zn-ribbon and HTH transcriptional regulator